MATLSWLALGQTAKAPAMLWVGRPLSKQQWKAVNRLESYLGDLEKAGDFEAAAKPTKTIGPM